MADRSAYANLADAVLRYLGIKNAKRLTTEQIVAVSADGTAQTSSGHSLRTSGDYVGLRAGQQVPVLWSREAGNLRGGVMPAAILAHQARHGAVPHPATRTTRHDAVEELFLAAPETGGGWDVWFRDATQAYQVGHVSGSVRLIRWGASGDHAVVVGNALVSVFDVRSRALIRTWMPTRFQFPSRFSNWTWTTAPQTGHPAFVLHEVSQSFPGQFPTISGPTLLDALDVWLAADLSIVVLLRVTSTVTQESDWGPHVDPVRSLDWLLVVGESGLVWEAPETDAEGGGTVPGAHTMMEAPLIHQTSTITWTYTDLALTAASFIGWNPGDQRVVSGWLTRTLNYTRVQVADDFTQNYVRVEETGASARITFEGTSNTAIPLMLTSPTSYQTSSWLSEPTLPRPWTVSAFTVSPDGLVLWSGIHGRAGLIVSGVFASDSQTESAHVLELTGSPSQIGTYLWPSSAPIAALGVRASAVALVGGATPGFVVAEDSAKAHQAETSAAVPGLWPTQGERSHFIDPASLILTPAGSLTVKNAAILKQPTPVTALADPLGPFLVGTILPPRYVAYQLKRDTGP